MKCYYHQTVDAVALCKSCSRALCADCISEVGLSCSCRNRCEADVATLNDLVQRGRSAYQKASANQFRSALFTFGLGIVFLVLALAGVGGSLSEWNLFPLIMGILFAGWGVSQFISARRMSQK